MLSYLEQELNKKERRKVIKYMSQYRNLDAIIETKKMDLHPSLTASYDDMPKQSTRSFHSECEDYVINSEEIEEYEKVKRKLDLAYKSIKPTQRIIWDECFVDGRTDPDVYYGHDMSRRSFYREKGELLKIVAGCLGVNGTKRD